MTLLLLLSSFYKTHSNLNRDYCGFNLYFLDDPSYRHKTPVVHCNEHRKGSVYS